MVIKKKKGKKSKKGVKSSGGEDRSATDEPNTLISAENGSDVAEPSKKGKKGKKKGKKGKKLSKSDKALETLEKACNAIREDTEKFDLFVARMDKWLSGVAQKAVDLLCRFDFAGQGILSFDEFKSAMYDMNIPCNSTELHLLCQMLDYEGSMSIDYTNLSKGLMYEREDESDDDDDDDYEEEGTAIAMETQTEVTSPLREVRLLPQNIPLEHCICCHMALCEPYKEKNPGYIELLMRLITFENLRAHPAHFNQIVHAHIPILGILKIVEKIAGIQSSKLAVFTDKSRNKEAMLSRDMTLEECGFYGGTKQKPEELLLYYDYTVEFVNCPILMCDHYFGGES
ncbi:uncharacterized protein LOC141901224 [Tubulanus polymorphus]|uniref:uncharacterized protein LOC141901224 n=1 Tax=Tubulanus polymorphus TaxID=672921 RepID=UPI003DA55B80